MGVSVVFMLGDIGSERRAFACDAKTDGDLGDLEHIEVTCEG